MRDHVRARANVPSAPSDVCDDGRKCIGTHARTQEKLPGYNIYVGKFPCVVCMASESITRRTLSHRAEFNESMHATTDDREALEMGGLAALNTLQRNGVACSAQVCGPIKTYRHY